MGTSSRNLSSGRSQLLSHLEWWEPGRQQGSGLTVRAVAPVGALAISENPESAGIYRGCMIVEASDGDWVRVV